MAGKTQGFYEGHHELAQLANVYLSQKDTDRGGIAGQLYIAAIAARKEVADYIRGGKKFADAIVSGAETYLQRFVQGNVGSLLSRVSKFYNGPRLQTLKALANSPIAYFADAANKYDAAQKQLKEAQGQKDPKVASLMAAKAMANIKKYEKFAAIYSLIESLDTLRIEAKYSAQIIRDRMEETLGGLEQLVLGKQTELSPAKVAA